MRGRWELDLKEVWDDRRSGTVNPVVSTTLMRELVQHWCHSRRIFSPLKPPMEIATVSTVVGDSDATVSALGWYESWHEKGHSKKNSREKGKGKGKIKGKGKNSGGKGKVAGGLSNVSNGGLNRFVVAHIWKWRHKKARCHQ